jgi:hypothetical protein
MDVKRILHSSWVTANPEFKRVQRLPCSEDALRAVKTHKEVSLMNMVPVEGVQARSQASMGSAARA